MASIDTKLAIFGVAIAMTILLSLAMGHFQLFTPSSQSTRCHVLPIISTLGGAHHSILTPDQFRLNTSDTCHDACISCQSCNAPAIAAFQHEQSIRLHSAEAMLDDTHLQNKLEEKRRIKAERKKEEEEAAKKSQEKNLELQIREETTAACGRMYTLENQWFILNHANQADPVNETVAMAYFKEKNYPESELKRYDEIFSMLRWWGHAYYHGWLEAVPYINAMSYWYMEQPQPLPILAVLANAHWVGLEWIGFNRRLSSYPSKVFFVKKYHHIKMDGLPLPCIIQWRARVWRMFSQPQHYLPEKQHILVCQRLGSRGIVNYEQLVRHMKQKFPNELVARSYGDENTNQLRDLMFASKVVIWSHGANSANIHLFGPPHAGQAALFHIDNTTAARLKPLTVIEITFKQKDGNPWRHVEWEMGQHGYKYHRILCEIQPSLDEYKRQNPDKPLVLRDENDLQPLSFILTNEAMDQISKIVEEALRN